LEETSASPREKKEGARPCTRERRGKTFSAVHRSHKRGKERRGERPAATVYLQTRKMASSARRFRPLPRKRGLITGKCPIRSSGHAPTGHERGSITRAGENGTVHNGVRRFIWSGRRKVKDLATVSSKSRRHRSPEKRGKKEKIGKKEDSYTHGQRTFVRKV